MDNKQIEKILKNNKNFIGVFPRNIIPKKFKKYPAGLIINTDSSNEPGEHWIAILVKDNKKGEYFDPFGLPPLHKDFIDYLDTVCSRGWTFNSLTLQHINSKSCGLFCICYLNSRFLGKSFIDFISSFSVNQSKNDLFLKKCLQNGICSNF